MAGAQAVRPMLLTIAVTIAGWTLVHLPDSLLSAVPAPGRSAVTPQPEWTRSWPY
jgi:hypothetical protein